MTQPDPQPATKKKPASASPASDGLTAPEELRQKILRPYFPLLHDWLRHDLESADVPESAELEGRRVPLGRWEQRQFRAFRIAPAFGLKPEVSLVLEGVAFQFASHKLSKCFETGPMPPPEEIPRFLDEIVAQLAVGIALASLLQTAIDAQVQQGKLDEAKHLTEFRGRVVRQLTDLKARVGGLELDRAEESAPALIAARDETMDEAELEGDAGLLRLLDEIEEPLPSWASFADEDSAPEEKLPPWLHDELIEPERRSKRRTAPSNRTRPMLMILAALIAVYAIVIWPRVSSERPPMLAEKHFVGIDVVREVRARPPSLFIVVDELTWDATAPEQKVELVEEMGAVADQAGYSGVHIRADGGRVVAEWLRTTGAAIRQASGGSS